MVDGGDWELINVYVPEENISAMRNELKRIQSGDEVWFKEHYPREWEENNGAGRWMTRIMRGVRDMVIHDDGLVECNGYVEDWVEASLSAMNYLLKKYGAEGLEKVAEYDGGYSDSFYHVYNGELKWIEQYDDLKGIPYKIMCAKYFRKYDPVNPLKRIPVEIMPHRSIDYDLEKFSCMAWISKEYWTEELDRRLKEAGIDGEMYTDTVRYAWESPTEDMVKRGFKIIAEEVAPLFYKEDTKLKEAMGELLKESALLDGVTFPDLYFKPERIDFDTSTGKGGIKVWCEDGIGNELYSAYFPYHRIMERMQSKEEDMDMGV